MAHDNQELGQLVDILGPFVTQIVHSSINRSLRDVFLQRSVSGTVEDTDGSFCSVAMDDGGIDGSPTPGQIQCIRMTGVNAGDRVRVHFFPDASAEAHRVET